MVSSILSAFLCLGASAASEQPNWASIVAAVNVNPESSWQATLPSDRDVHRAVDLVGGFIPFRSLYPNAATHPLPRMKTSHEFKLAVEDLPTGYDSRAAYVIYRTPHTMQPNVPWT